MSPPERRAEAEADRSARRWAIGVLVVLLGVCGAAFAGIGPFQDDTLYCGAGEVHIMISGEERCYDPYDILPACGVGQVIVFGIDEEGRPDALQCRNFEDVDAFDLNLVDTYEPFKDFDLDGDGKFSEDELMAIIEAGPPGN